MLDVSPPLLTLSMESSRKRRRETSNGGNTLDALVARNGCSNGEPLASRCLAENDAIESPDDLIEMKVSTLTRSLFDLLLYLQFARSCSNGSMISHIYEHRSNVLEKRVD